MPEFRFMDYIEIKELLGKKADDEQELLEIIEEVSSDSGYRFGRVALYHDGASVSDAGQP